MSLKAFHIFFIALSVLLAFGFSAWLVDSFMADKNGLVLIAAAISFLIGIVLILYGIRFLRKLRHVSFI